MLIQHLVDFRNDIYKQQQLVDKFYDFATDGELVDLKLRSQFYFFIYETMDSYVEDSNTYFKIIYEFYKVKTLDDFFEYWKGLGDKQVPLLTMLQNYNSR